VLRIFLSLLVTLMFVQAHAEAPSVDLKSLGDLMNSYDSISEFTKDFRAFGLMTSEEETGINIQLKMHGLTPETKLGKVKIQDRTVAVGHLKFTIDKDGRIKTGRGRFLNFKPGLKADQIFEMAFHADAIQPVADLVSAALTPVFFSGFKVAGVIGYGICGSITAANLTIEKVVYAARNLGHLEVVCGAHGEYILNRFGKGKDLSAQISKWESEYAEEAKDPARGWSDWGIAPLFKSHGAYCLAINQSWVGLKKSFSSPLPNGDIAVSPEVIKAAFPHDAGRKCDPNSQQEVISVLRQRGKTLQEKIARFNSGNGYDNGRASGESRGVSGKGAPAVN
jgi:hypothetical protein